MLTAIPSLENSRRAQRFCLEEVIAFRSLEDEFEDASGVTRDVSASGLFFYSQKYLRVGSTIELFLMMPSGPLLTEGVFPLHAVGRVVRVEPCDERYGVAVAFEKIEVVAEA